LATTLSGFPATTCGNANFAAPATTCAPGDQPAAMRSCCEKLLPWPSRFAPVTLLSSLIPTSLNADARSATGATGPNAAAKTCIAEPLPPVAFGNVTDATALPATSGTEVRNRLTWCTCRPPAEFRYGATAAIATVPVHQSGTDIAKPCVVPSA
jgi:hypothetical protein